MGKNIFKKVFSKVTKKGHQRSATSEDSASPLDQDNHPPQQPQQPQQQPRSSGGIPQKSKPLRPVQWTWRDPVREREEKEEAAREAAGRSGGGNGNGSGGPSSSQRGTTTPLSDTQSSSDFPSEAAEEYEQQRNSPKPTPLAPPPPSHTSATSASGTVAFSTPNYAALCQLEYAQRPAFYSNRWRWQEPTCSTRVDADTVEAQPANPPGPQDESAQEERRRSKGSLTVDIVTSRTTGGGAASAAAAVDDRANTEKLDDSETSVDNPVRLQGSAAVGEQPLDFV